MTVRRIVGSSVAGLILGAGLWLLGVDAWFAAAMGVLLALICVMWGVFRSDDESSLVWATPSREPRPGSRTDVARLAPMFQQNRGSVREQGFAAVRALAQSRLDRHELRLGDPADRERIVALIGQSAYATLTPHHGIMPSLRAVEQCLDALDVLGAQGALVTPRAVRTTEGPART
ncbi:hypothetical protein [Planctomonas sp. JC2975]|uniref:hypothetical protein n=1 Tax=Planctomonas sp. JC2975 TaxID=2729626 RepID=UPI001F0EF27C|nr:hypothetical protein [Planctomonas sp. JC2975]